MSVRILTGDCIDVMRTMPNESVQCCVTSPPYYGLRDYGVEGQLGMEKTPEEYVAKMVAVFREVHRVLREDGTLWLNIGDSYAANRTYQVHNTKGAAGHTYGKSSEVPPGCKPKDLIGIPWMLAFALRADGWWLRSDIIWHKPNPMPESVTDRPTKAHEYVFLMSKAERYFYDADAISERAKTPGSRGIRSPYSVGSGREDGSQAKGGIIVGEERNSRTVWTINPSPCAEAHFATMPPALAEKCIRAGTKEGDTVLDPFGGAMTTGLVAQRLNRNAVLCELNPVYVDLGRNRLVTESPLFSDVLVSSPIAPPQPREPVSPQTQDGAP